MVTTRIRKGKNSNSITFLYAITIIVSRPVKNIERESFGFLLLSKSLHLKKCISRRKILWIS
jgi:hypothetical protein